MKPRSIRRNFVAFVVARIIYGVCQWANLAILAKLGSRELVGEFALAYAVAAPVVVFSRLHLRAVQATDTTEQYAFSDYVRLTVLTSLAALAVLSGLAWWFEHTGMRTQLMFLAAAVLISESFSNLVYGAVQQRERLDLTAVSVIVRSVGATTLGAVLFAWRGELPWFLIGLLTVYVTTLVLIDRPLMKRLRAENPEPVPAKESTANSSTGPKTLSDEFAVLGKLAWLALPLGMTMWLLLLEMNIPRYFIEHYVGTAELGVFAALLTFIGPGGVIAVGMGNAALPRFAQYFAQGRLAEFRWLLIRMMSLAAIVGLAVLALMAVAGRPIISLLFTPQYAEHRSAMLVIMLCGVFLHISAVAGSAVTAMRRFWVPLWVHAICVTVIIIGSAALISTWGLFGAAVALAFCTCAAAVLFAAIGLTAK